MLRVKENDFAMSTLQTPRPRASHPFFRALGLLTGLAGLVFIVVGMVSFYRSLGGEQDPRLFWCVLVGMPMLFVGLVLSSLGSTPEGIAESRSRSE